MKLYHGLLAVVICRHDKKLSRARSAKVKTYPNIDQPNTVTVRCSYMTDAKLRDAYEEGLQNGQGDGLPDACPFEHQDALSKRFAWLSGFSVGKAVKLAKLKAVTSDRK